jgi:hypothetical protein
VGEEVPDEMLIKYEDEETKNAVGSIHQNWQDEKPNLEEGDTLWNCEVIEFSSVDENGNNLVYIAPPAKIAHIGADVWTLSLTNDYDTLAVSTEGTIIGDSIEIGYETYKGHASTTDGDILIESVGISGDAYSLDKINKTITIDVSKISPTFEDRKLVIKWISNIEAENPVIYDVQNFILKTINAICDYDLVIP